jgi:hypothetical protein
MEENALLRGQLLNRAHPKGCGFLVTPTLVSDVHIQVVGILGCAKQRQFGGVEHQVNLDAER